MLSIELNNLIDKLDFDTPSSLPRLGVYKISLHLVQMFVAFITLCATAPIISAENEYIGSSQAAPNYTLAVTLITLFLSAPLAVFPWIMMSKKGLGSIRKFFLRPRVTVILTCFMSMGWFAAMISMTVHSRNPSNCTLNSKLKDNEDYVSTWSKQCNTAKAAAAFCWISFFVGIATVVCSAILLWHEKKLRQVEMDHKIAAATAADVSTKEASSSNSDSSTTTLDDDARTIVDMKYSEGDKQPVVRYQESASPYLPPQMQETNEAVEPSLSATVDPSIAANGFSSPHLPSLPSNTYSPLMSAPYTPQTNVTTSVGYAGSPYSNTSNSYSNLNLQQPYNSPYQAHSNYASNASLPFSYQQQTPPAQYNNTAVVPNAIITSPYPPSATIPQYQTYRSSPLYQQTTASSDMYKPTTPSPLSQKQQPSLAQMHQQTSSNYVPQDYDPCLTHI